MLHTVKQKITEAFTSVFPIALLVFLFSVTLTPMSPAVFLQFVMGVVCLLIGMALFTMGVEMSMQTLGDRIGASVARSGKMLLAAFVGMLIGIFVTLSEPDLSILAEQVSDIPNLVLILTVSVGVGVFLAIACLRVFLKWSFRILLLIFYTMAMVLCFFVPSDFWAIAFDAGGVTTGPMTVPFIMAIGAGLSGVRSGSSARDDSFGLVALCSIGPILSVMILGICYGASGGTYAAEILQPMTDTREGAYLFIKGFAESGEEILLAMAPIIVFTLFFQLLTKSFNKTQLIRIAIGLLYTCVGLTVFLTGANVGFMPTGTALGQILASTGKFWLVPAGMLLGFFIVRAEPSVYVLNKQVERISAGAITASTMGTSLSIGVSLALGLSMVRIISGISILWILIPGYVLVLALSFFVPPFFTGIAFDSGGVASGTMMSAFVLPMAIGACAELGGNVMTQAFGCVSFVALTPILSIQICGLIYNVKSGRAVRKFNREEEEFIDYIDLDAAVSREEGRN